MLPRALRHMLAKADERTKAAVNKVVRVWDERKVSGWALLQRRAHAGAAAAVELDEFGAAAAAVGGCVGLLHRRVRRRAGFGEGLCWLVL